MLTCPCGSSKLYQDCCGKCHNDHAEAKTPEALMRSRYAAYAMANIAYIKKTMQGKPLEHFNEIDALHWATSVSWLGLNVLHSQQVDDLGHVEFIATYIEDDFLHTIHEISEFKRINHHWYYVDGKPIKTPASKISRNSPCPCGSSKKFKHCHAVK